MKAQGAREKAVITEYVQIYLGNKYDFYSTFFQKDFVSIKSTTQGRLGGTAVKRLPSARGVISALWDRAPHQALPL